jgi:hypothetical protein
MSYHAQFEHWIAVPLEKVFAFFADPMNLPGIMPTWLEMRFEEMVVAPPTGAPAYFAGVGTNFFPTFRSKDRSEAGNTGMSSLRRHAEELRALGFATASSMNSQASRWAGL